MSHRDCQGVGVRDTQGLSSGRHNWRHIDLEMPCLLLPRAGLPQGSAQMPPPQRCHLFIFAMLSPHPLSLSPALHMLHTDNHALESVAVIITIGKSASEYIHFRVLSNVLLRFPGHTLLTDLGYLPSESLHG